MLWFIGWMQQTYYIRGEQLEALTEPNDQGVNLNYLKLQLGAI